MVLNSNKATVLVFDYGNTLIEFGAKQIAEQYTALCRCLQEFGSFNPNHLHYVHRRLLDSPEMNGFRENYLPDVYAELLKDVVGVEPDHEKISAIFQKRRDSFVSSVKPSSGLHSVLEKLKKHFRLSIISNYPCGQAIRSSLDNIEISHLFETVIVSGDIGYVKPHPLPFQMLLKRLEVRPSDCIFIGDNWHADIQGAKAIGMQAILTTQYEPYKAFLTQPDDRQPDAQVTHLNCLLKLLLEINQNQP